MKIIFYIFSIYPLKLAFNVCDGVFKFLPLRILRTLTPFRVTRKNLSIVFPNLSSQELDSLAKASYLETLKSIYETLLFHTFFSALSLTFLAKQYFWKISKKSILFGNPLEPGPAKCAFNNQLTTSKRFADKSCSSTKYF